VGGSDGAQIGEEEGGRVWGGCIFIRPGAFRIIEHLLATRVYQRHRGECIFIRQGPFLTMEHLLAVMVSVPASPRQMHIHSARGISDNGALIGDEG
jgi:hypothetical protein